jgi:hypothetical protein
MRARELLAGRAAIASLVSSSFAITLVSLDAMAPRNQTHTDDAQATSTLNSF